MNQQMPDYKNLHFTSKFPRHVFSSGGSKNGNVIDLFFETNLMKSLKNPQKLNVINNIVIDFHWQLTNATLERYRNHSNNWVQYDNIKFRNIFVRLHSEDIVFVSF